MPATVDKDVADVHARAFPEGRLTAHRFNARLVAWVLVHRTPLLLFEAHEGWRR